MPRRVSQVWSKGGGHSLLGRKPSTLTLISSDSSVRGKCYGGYKNLRLEYALRYIYSEIKKSVWKRKQGSKPTLIPSNKSPCVAIQFTRAGYFVWIKSLKHVAASPQVVYVGTSLRLMIPSQLSKSIAWSLKGAQATQVC